MALHDGPIIAAPVEDPILGASSMTDKGFQKGPARHAADQHGPKAHSEFIDSLHGKHGGSEESEGAPQQGSPYGESDSDGKHRLDEGREQHDPAEKNSEAANQTERRMDRAGGG